MAFSPSRSSRQGLRAEVLRTKLYPLKEGLINDVVTGQVQALGAWACTSGFMVEPERCRSKNQRLCAVVRSFCRYFPKCLFADCPALHQAVFPESGLGEVG